MGNVLISLGCNQNSVWGDATLTIAHALKRLADEFQQPPKTSRLFATPAFPAGAGPDFVNAACTIQSSLAPNEILQKLHGIEAEALRNRDKRWAPRTLDLDLLAIDDLVLPDLPGWKTWHDLPLDVQMKSAPEQLILPHPRLQDRSFVLVPLTEVAPDWTHPILGKSVIAMRDALPAAELAAVVPL